MMDLVYKFERFRRSHVAPNPEREAELTAFTRKLSEDGELGEYTDEDWLTLSRKLGLNDDQYAALMEGTASWIVDEPESITKQPSSDWPDEVPREARAASKPSENPGRATRGISSKSARRGTQEFDDLMQEVEDEWELDDEELDNIVEVRRAGDSFEIRLKGEDRWELLEDDEEGDDEDGSVIGEDEDFGGGEEE
jgi:hypothetical protein